MPDLFGPNVLKRRTIVTTPNPLDKCTVISIYPRDIEETKPTIQPSKFIIPKGTEDKPSFTIIGPASWWRDIDPEQPLIEIPQPSITVAESVVNDYCNGLLGYTKDKSQPGLFWVPGEINDLPTLIKTKFSLLNNVSGELLYKKAIQMQKTYWETLVKLADTGWTKSNGNPLTISDMMRYAAERLGLKDKPWMKDMAQMELVTCPMCGSMIKPNFPVCSNCKAVIDPKKAEALGIKFAL